MFKQKNDFKEILSGQVISVTGGIFAGLLLAIAEDKVFLVPGVFVLIPGFLAMRNILSDSFSDKIDVYLMAKKLKPDFRTAEHSKIVFENILASFVLVFFISTLLGFFSFIVTYFFFKVYVPVLIAVSIVAGLISNVVELPLVLTASILFFKKRIDLGNVMGPFASTTGDIVSVLSILLAIMVIL